MRETKTDTQVSKQVLSRPLLECLKQMNYMLVDAVFTTPLLRHEEENVFSTYGIICTHFCQ